MTIANPALGQASESELWEPYPELERAPKDMLQSRPANYLKEMLLSILTPGASYQDHSSILIGDQIPIYYGTTDPASNRTPHVIPDCLVALDVDCDAIWQRVGYDPLQNGKPPDFVIEVASRSTHRRDTLQKREVYRMLEVPEYWRFDPTGGRYYGRAIIGEHLVNGQYEAFPLIRYDGAAVGATSPILNLNFRWRERRFWVHDPATGEAYQHPQEMTARLRESNYRLQGANERLQGRTDRLQGAKDRLQEENDRLQAEIRRLRGEETPD